MSEEEPPPPKRGRPSNTTKDKASALDTHLYGWDRELQLAYRVLATNPKGPKVYSKPIKVPDQPAERQCVEAVWPDGDRKVMHEMSIEAYTNANKSRKKDEIEPLLVAEHKKNHHRVSVAQRTDRCLLISVYEQSRQVLQLRADAFGPLPDPQPAVTTNDNPTIKKVWFFYSS